MISDEIIRAWEERVGTETAHLVTGKRVTPEFLNNMFNQAFEWIDPTNKTVMDYGCGGGFLGEYLVKNKKINRYVGVDITDRSIRATKARLKPGIGEKRVTLARIDPNTIGDLSLFKIDVFACFNVIQHFPDKDYFDYFFRVLNDSEVEEIVLSIRYGRELIFQENPYKTTHEINMACTANTGNIVGRLTNYTMKNFVKPGKFALLYFRKNKND